MDPSTARGHGGRAAPSAADLVYAHAKRAIMTREYAPNDLITEGELAAVAGVSRTPVREALLRLQGEGMVRLLPKRGALVLAITAEEAADIMQLRRMFELHAVRAAMSRPREALAARLEGEMTRMRAAIADGDVSAYVAADRSFHLAIIAVAGNSIMAELYDGLRDRQVRMSANLYGADGAPDFTRPIAMLPDHQAILDAVATGTTQDAEAAIDAHLDHARQTFRYA
jgi:DNA-binding GntR family transcriptional regulator